MPKPAKVAAKSGEQGRSSGKRQRGASAAQSSGLHFGDPDGSWGDNKLSLLSAQASAELASPVKGDGAGAPLAGSDTSCREPPHPAQQPLPCDSEGLTAQSEPTSPVASGTTAATEPGEAPVSSTPLEQHDGSRRTKRHKKGGLYAGLIGREVDVPASIFDIQVPDLFYRAVVKKKDTAHPRAVVIRFPEDGSTFWLPVDEVQGYIADMEARRGLGDKSLAGERSAAYAAEVLVSLSGAASSSVTRHSSGAAGLAGGTEALRHGGAGDGAESAMAMPVRKRMRAS